ncbi:MAG: nicotinate-nucleotide adenylyltransferase [Oscillospiraceae bacterium]|nr:nicotinate-nucleotide adenylyltransferase [Oscillospiraceae bacterium]
MEKLAIFGGTFNPIHNGHINLAKRFKDELSLDRVVLMPAKKSPWKSGEELVCDEDRLNMCSLAAEGLSGFEVSNYEIKKGGTSYTVETLRYFKQAYPDSELYFIMGGDMFLSLEKWFCFEEILSLCTILAAARRGGEYENLKIFEDRLKGLYGAKTRVLEMEPYEISSSEIRKMIKLRKDFSCYLPERVVKYIMSKNLYS